MCDVELVDVLARNAEGAIRFVEQAGVDLGLLTQLGGHSKPRTHREPNSPDGKPRPIGYDITAALRKRLEGVPADRFTRLTDAHVVRLLQQPTGRISGVVYVNSTARDDGPPAEQEVAAHAVILATGGYSADRDGLLAEYAPQVRELPTTNGPWARGEGVRLGKAVGAELIHMDQVCCCGGGSLIFYFIFRALLPLLNTRPLPHPPSQVQVHPTSFVDPADPDAGVKFLAPEALRGVGGILLSARGERFVDELAPRDTVTGGIFVYASLAQPHRAAFDDPPSVREILYKAPPRPAEAYLVLDPEAAAAFGPNFFFYHRVKKFFLDAKGPAGVAQAINAFRRARNADAPQLATPERVEAALRAYNAAARGTTGDSVGKVTFPRPIRLDEGETSPLLVAAITPAIHYTMGGLHITPQAAVRRSAEEQRRLREEQERRVQLGEIKKVSEPHTIVPGLYAAGEVSGGVHGANRLGGNSLLECVVFGRVAAHSACFDLQLSDGQQPPKGKASSNNAQGGGHDEL
jgi:succinate dehydrogenase/fumarate reductase flavoprotein subunit